MPHVFDGITILDFTWGMPGCLATMVLSDFGAEVIKVEPPGGDLFRDSPGAIQWNRGKKSIVLDMKSADGCEKAQHLARQADVVMESFRPGVTHRLGIDYETLSAGRPALVYCSLTGFGARGPYAHFKGYEGVVAAKSGRMMMFAGQNRPDGPNYVAVSNASYSAASALLRGVIAALFVRDRTGQGQKVETSLLQTITSYDLRDWIVWQMTAKDPQTYFEDPSLLRNRTTTGYLAAQTQDGQWIQLANLVERLFRMMLHSLDMDHVYEEPRFQKLPAVLDDDRDALHRIMLERVRGKIVDEWMDMFISPAFNVGAEPYMTSLEGMDHPQVVHNGHIVDVEDPRLGRTRQLGPIVTLSETPGGPHGPAPDPGQHTEELLNRLNGRTKTTAHSSLPLPGYPLEGVTVLDLSTIINGPLACSLLAELGARVIRIESPDGDWIRNAWYGLSVHRTMAGTEGLCLNLKSPEGQDILRKLVVNADILVHNMRPGAPERTGIGYEQLRQLNPNLVYVYAAGYGSTGPYVHRPSMHPIPGAVCGGALAQLGEDTLVPSERSSTTDEIIELSRKLGRANDGTADQNSSMAISVGMLLGLYARERTGKAQHVEGTLLGGNAYANAEDFFWHKGKPPRLIPDAQGYGLHALYRLYPARNGWVFLACPFEEEWRALCTTIGRPDLLEDLRFATAQSRKEHDDALAEELGQVLATKDASEWEKLLTATDVACVKVEDRGMYQFYNDDPHVQENGFTTEVESRRLGRFWRHSPILRFSHTQGRVGPGPLKGEHTQAILREMGYSQKVIHDMKERGVVEWEEV